ncbi:MAG: fibronectin type III domain-containing protein [Oscillospiraceae bacterium]|nr:fibronectin type III domain-containing protein [Oscillospiraceae bacterium]
MKMKKILSTALAFVVAFGAVTAVPDINGENSGFAITSEAVMSTDFVIEEDDDGLKWIVEYKGNGGHVKIPKGVAVDKHAFYGNMAVKSVTFEGECNVGTEAFSRCYNLETITANGVLKIHDGAFSWCLNLKEVNLKKGVTNKIGNNAFELCQNLEKVTIAKGSNKFVIDEYVFNECASLKTVSIPSTCTRICSNAFINCYNLSEIVIPSNTTFEQPSNNQHIGYSGIPQSNGSIKYERNDGKKSFYMYVYSDKGNGVSVGFGLVADKKKITPKELTLIVTKGSDAEQYAKSFKIKYKYPSSKLAAPSGFTSSSTASSIKLKWKAVEGADAYRVYKYNAKTGKYEKYKTVNSAACSISGLKKNTTYKFKVVALDEVNGKYKAGATSKSVSVKTTG